MEQYQKEGVMHQRIVTIAWDKVMREHGVDAIKVAEWMTFYYLWQREVGIHMHEIASHEEIRYTRYKRSVRDEL